MKYKPTDAELEILSILWDKSEASVREIHDVLSQTKDTGYTTTLKTMQIMFSKGLLSRSEQGRSHLYMPAITEKETQNSLLSSFMDSTFGGSAKKLIMRAIGQSNPSKEEINEIRQLLNELENKQ
ncbi:BlaI/MecI/CopY family transcriptional regulator [Echinicola marina]|uniref:BlaI/MecI/CopY family transcriptional regulator n=1 Tax=Echinicola marina TaxID=2859768 RepID=UPI001CF697EC|nr:BlaI/MecI/CopY family transcriptional regulator [Echinicola marina]UCS95316.1 BlaI/MecI/CopY family transcriptional regulator [Echinicola marina]